MLGMDEGVPTAVATETLTTVLFFSPVIERCDQPSHALRSGVVGSEIFLDFRFLGLRVRTDLGYVLGHSPSQ